MGGRKYPDRRGKVVLCTVPPRDARSHWLPDSRPEPTRRPTGARAFRVVIAWVRLSMPPQRREKRTAASSPNTTMMAALQMSETTA
jgi:hypothetical protein